ncbi:chromosome segregation protein SMC [Halobacteria archaeon HArc-gm2]|nr:chromosome segregation protein SMC [Halobacteria archaeon HArc-gm2]
MTTTQHADQLARFQVEKIGGIDETSVDVPPGVTVLAGKNATNRTSFLQAIQAALGSTEASLKGDADTGDVQLDLGEETYERSLQRTNGHVSFSGNGYLDDATVADLFAFLLEANEARRAVARAEDLREIIMRPVDIDAIREEIRRLEDEKETINDDLAEIGSLKQELPTLEQRRTALRDDIAQKRDELEAKEEEIEASSASIEETRNEKAQFEEKLDELRDTRSDLEQVRYEIESTDDSITSLKQERNDLEAELADLPEAPMGDHADLDAEIDRLRKQKQTVEREIQDLQSAIQFNEEMLDDEGEGVLDELVEDGDSDVTARLVEDDEVVCWTCGSEVTADQIDSTLESLRSLRETKLGETSDIEDRLEELQSEQREAERQQEQRTTLERRLDDVDSEIESRRDRLDELRTEKSALTDDVESLETEVEKLESDDFSEVLDLHKEANQLEFELGRLESDLEDVSGEIESIEEAIAREDELRQEREGLLDELEECRTRIDQIEADAVEQFNTHMEAILDVLGYDNLERIWIERLEQTVRQGREKVTTTVFELHVVRSTESGAAYEDTVAHLSESEREVTGLVFALAGYLVHDVHEEVPFMLLDSLEAIDSDRIAALVDYLSEYASYLVVALLPEDAQALDDEYTRITDI